MSAFLMSDQRIAEISSFIIWNYQENKYADVYIKNDDKTVIYHACLKHYKRNHDSYVTEQTLFLALKEMNLNALKQRYNHSNIEPIADYPKEKFPWYKELKNKYQMYKTFQCYIYQCSEGDIPDTEFYKTITNICHNIAYTIIDESPEYQKCSWL